MFSETQFLVERERLAATPFSCFIVFNIYVIQCSGFLELWKMPGYFPHSVMWNGILIIGLLFLLVSYICRDHIYCLDQDLYGSKTSAAEDSLFMALTYTAYNLLNLKRNYYISNDTYELCRNVGILRPPRYIQSALRHRFTHSSLDYILVPSFKSSLSSTALPQVKSALFNARSVNN